MVNAKTKMRKLDHEGKLTGKIIEDQPTFDSRQYKIEFLDGSIDAIARNFMIENYVYKLIMMVVWSKFSKRLLIFLTMTPDLVKMTLR